MKYVENGYIDSEFEPVLNATDRQYQLGTKEHEYKQAWDAVLNSFDDGQEKVSKLIEVFSKSIDVINLTKLNNVTELMKQLGDDDRADGIEHQP